MKFAKVCGIYKIENKINGKKYIGQSIDIHRRWVDHRRDIKARNYFLYQAFKKYGISNFSFEIIEECTEEELNEKEAYWIKFYDTYNNGYNMTLGGSGLEGLFSNRDIIPKNLSQILGYDINEPVSVVELSESFEIINEWPSIQSCARDTNLFATNITKCCRLKYKSTGNRIFMYKSDIINLTQCEIKEFRNKLRSDLNFVDHHSTKKKSIVQIDSNGNIICVFKSANNAAEILNLDCSSIVKVCKCRLKQTQGYYFSYIDAVDEDSQVKIDF